MIYQSSIHANPYQQMINATYADQCKRSVESIPGGAYPTVTVECSVYDMVIPSNFVTPFDIFQQVGNLPLHNTHVLLFTLDPYSTPTDIPPTVITQIYGDKSDPYNPKSINCEVVELGWIGFYIVGSYICIHHNQVHGILSQNNKLRKMVDVMYRAQISTICDTFPTYKIIVPTTATMLRCFTQTHDIVPIPTRAYGSNIMKRCGFEQTVIGNTQLDVTKFNLLLERDMTIWTKI